MYYSYLQLTLHLSILFLWEPWVCVKNTKRTIYFMRCCWYNSKFCGLRWPWMCHVWFGCSWVMKSSLRCTTWKRLKRICNNVLLGAWLRISETVNSEFVNMVGWLYRIMVSLSFKLNKNVLLHKLSQVMCHINQNSPVFVTVPVIC